MEVTRHERADAIGRLEDLVHQCADKEWVFSYTHNPLSLSVHDREHVVVSETVSPGQSFLFEDIGISRVSIQSFAKSFLTAIHSIEGDVEARDRLNMAASGLKTLLWRENFMSASVDPTELFRRRFDAVRVAYEHHRADLIAFPYDVFEAYDYFARKERFTDAIALLQNAATKYSGTTLCINGISELTSGLRHSNGELVFEPVVTYHTKKVYSKVFKRDLARIMMSE